MTYERTASSEFELIDRWDDGFGWIARPDEDGQRASHAVRGNKGLWLLDPLEAPGIVEHIDDLEGEVAGVAVCSSWHARDAEWFAHRYDVPVFAPEWMSRVAKRIDGPIRRYEGRFDPAIQVVRCQPMPLWDEAILHFELHQTLYVPESLGTVAAYTVGDERLGLEVFRRLDPPRSLRRFEPERVLVGHGAGILEDATGALEDALTGSRRGFPRALLENGPTTVRAVVDAMRT